MAQGCKLDARTWHRDIKIMMQETWQKDAKLMQEHITKMQKKYARNMVLGYQTDTKYMARKCKTNARNQAQGCKTDARIWLKDAKLMQEHGTEI